MRSECIHVNKTAQNNAWTTASNQQTWLSPDIHSSQAAKERHGPFKGHAHFGSKRKYTLRAPAVTSESRK